MATRAKAAGPITWRDALVGLVFLVTLMGGFGAWLLSRAEAAAEAPRRDLERVEQKVDGILLLLIKEREGRGETIPKEVRDVLD